MAESERVTLPYGFGRNEWGVLCEEIPGKKSWLKVLDIPISKNDLVNFSQYLVEIFANAGEVIVNLDTSVPIYPHEMAIIKHLMLDIGPSSESDTHIATLMQQDECIFDKLSILSCLILCIILYSKSLQLICVDQPHSFYAINELGVFSFTEKSCEDFATVPESSSPASPPPPWVLEMLNHT